MNNLSHSPAVFPCLPQDMTLSHLIELLERIARNIGLGPARREVLLRMIRQTAPGDWTSPAREPVCFRAQQDLAQELGISDRALRAHEKALALLGLIHIDTGANGRRSGRALSQGRRLGINFRPLIERIGELVARDAAHREEMRQCRILRLECSAAKRDVKELLEAALLADAGNPHLITLLQRRSSWPRRYACFASSQSLQAHLAEIEELRAACKALLECQRESSGRADAQIPTIGNTNPNLSDSCTGAETERMRLRIDRTAMPTADPSMKQAVDGGPHDRSTLSWLTPQALRDLAGPGLRFYLDATCPDGLPCPRSLRSAVFQLLPELEIGESVWEEAAAAFGTFGACLAVVIVDANRTHPTHPIRCPGAALRRFTQLQGQGAFSLAAALTNLRAWRRRTA